MNRSGKSQFLGHNNMLMCEKAKSVRFVIHVNDEAVSLARINMSRTSITRRR